MMRRCVVGHPRACAPARNETRPGQWRSPNDEWRIASDSATGDEAV